MTYSTFAVVDLGSRERRARHRGRAPRLPSVAHESSPSHASGRCPSTLDKTEAAILSVAFTAALWWIPHARLTRNRAVPRQFAPPVEVEVDHSIVLAHQTPLCPHTLPTDDLHPGAVDAADGDGRARVPAAQGSRTATPTHDRDPEVGELAVVETAQDVRPMSPLFRSRLFSWNR